MRQIETLQLSDLPDDSGNRIAYGRLTFNIVQMLASLRPGRALNTRQIARALQSDYNKINVTLNRLHAEGRIAREKRKRILNAPNGNRRECRRVNFWFYPHA